ncbi:MFS transporter [Desulfitobacterium sp. AusDCA]|uniref:MFS transporter n=1 Tax=Desulfitobacterium sp. AusDCA TaxID=3240383 RepID=UPI003DA76AD5
MNTYIQHGTSAFRKTNIAFFAGGFTTFAILYCTQPLLPELSREFNISPAMSSLSLSAATISMAISMLFVGSISEVRGRKPIMIFSLLGASILSLLTSMVSDFHVLLLFRMFQGIILAGLPSVAMAYLSEEIEPASLGVAMGLYISGNSVGGMSGRIIIGTLSDNFNWHIALAVIGMLSVLASFLFLYMLPASKNFRPRKMEIGKLTKSMLVHLRDPGLLCLYAIAFLLMGSFVTLYNYIGYQLIAPPYSLSQTLVGWIFIVYIVGTFSSTWMGQLSDKYGRRKVLWIVLLIMLIGVCITLSTNLILKIIGIVFFTFCFFGSHSIASSWVGLRATHDKAQASSLYLFFYYVGSSVGGTSGGIFWLHFGWSGVVSMISCFLLLAFFLSIGLSRIAPVVKTGLNSNK